MQFRSMNGVASTGKTCGALPFPHQDVRQLWFAGVHSDVGGSYSESESELSQITLEWIIEEAIAHGLIVRASRYAEVVPKRPENHRHRIMPPAATRSHPRYVIPNPHGKMHKSLHGAWWIAEFIPQRNEFTNRWHFPLGRHRFIETDSAIHESVVDRMKSGS